jgi:hypothetical protein
MEEGPWRSDLSWAAKMPDLEQLYFCIRQNLVARREHVARIIAGAACELWFSSESFAAVNWPNLPLLAPGYFAVTEDCKRDLIICDEAGRTVATVESKVVYNNKNLWQALYKLNSQMIRESNDDEIAECSRGGMIYVVWLDSFDQQDVKSEIAYHKVVQCEIDRLFPKEAYRQFPLNGFDTVVPRTDLNWSNKPTSASLNTKMVQRFETPSIN